MGDVLKDSLAGIDDDQWQEEKEEEEKELGARGHWSHKLYNWEQLAAS